MKLHQCRMQNAECRMKSRTAFHSAFCILHSALVIVLVLASPCAAQRSLSTNNVKPIVPRDLTPYGQRTDAFRRLLYEFKLKPVTDFAQLQAKPSESVLIVLGDPSCLSRGHFPKGLHSFVEHGGAVLIATDKEVNNEAREILDKLAGVTVTGETLVCPNPLADLYYHNEAYCPFVQLIAASEDLPISTDVLGTLAAVIGAGGRPALFRNPRPGEPYLRIATNAPSRLRELGWFGLPGGVHRLARLPESCRVEVSPDVLLVDSEQRKGPLFAVGGTRGEGRRAGAGRP